MKDSLLCRNKMKDTAPLIFAAGRMFFLVYLVISKVELYLTKSKKTTHDERFRQIFTWGKILSCESSIGNTEKQRHVYDRFACRLELRSQDTKWSKGARFLLHV